MLACVIMTTTGCFAQPDPEPTPLFSSEEEAFAAAEKTYRSYVDALNQVDLSDPETFEEVYAWTTGDLNASDRKGLSTYHADGASVDGDSSVQLIAPPPEGSVLDGDGIAVCLNVSDVVVTDADGNSLVDPDRVAVQSLTVRTVPDDVSPTGVLISSIGPREGAPTCEG